MNNEPCALLRGIWVLPHVGNIEVAETIETVAA
jgi:hypothetical protein